jgi:hypothetical protein
VLWGHRKRQRTTCDRRGIWISIRCLARRRVHGSALKKAAPAWKTSATVVFGSPHPPHVRGEEAMDRTRGPSASARRWAVMSSTWSRKGCTWSPIPCL